MDEGVLDESEEEQGHQSNGDIIGTEVGKWPADNVNHLRAPGGHRPSFPRTVLMYASAPM